MLAVWGNRKESLMAGNGICVCPQSSRCGWGGSRDPCVLRSLRSREGFWVVFWLGRSHCILSRGPRVGTACLKQWHSMGNRIYRSLLPLRDHGRAGVQDVILELWRTVF